MFGNLTRHVGGLRTKPDTINYWKEIKFTGLQTLKLGSLERRDTYLKHRLECQHLLFGQNISLNLELKILIM